MRRTPILALFVLIPVLSLLAACGASGGNDGASTDAKTTTTAAGSDDESTTTKADDDNGEAPTSAALAEILPTADEIGNGYELKDEDLDDAPEEPSTQDDGEADPTEQAILDACPGAKVLEDLDTGDGNPDEVSREFENASKGNTTIEVALDPTPDQFTEETIDKVVEALSDCEAIETEDEDGNKITIEINAEKSDEYGDFGLELKMSASFSLMGVEVPIEFRGFVFDVDGTTVSLVASSGLDDATLKAVPGDYDLLPDLATEMEDRVAAL